MPNLKKVSASDLRDNLNKLVTEVAYMGQRVVVTKHGHDMAVLVSMEDFELLQAAEEISR